MPESLTPVDAGSKGELPSCPAAGGAAGNITKTGKINNAIAKFTILFK
jgi:hypothetical protein